MTNKDIANRLIKLAKAIVSVEFNTEEEYKKYLQEHPDADKSKHTVKKKKTLKEKVKEKVKGIGKGLKKRKEKSQVVNKLTDSLYGKRDNLTKGETRVFVDGPKSVSVDTKEKSRQKVNIEEPEKNSDDVKSVLKDKGVWGEIVETSKKLKDVEKKYSSEKVAMALVKLAKEIVSAKTPSQLRKWTDLTQKYHDMYPSWPEEDYPSESLYNKNLFICIEMHPRGKYFFSTGYPLGGSMVPTRMVKISSRQYDLIMKDPIKGMVDAFGEDRVRKYLDRYNLLDKYSRVNWDAIIET